MKKVAFLLSFVFVAVLGMNSYAAVETVTNVDQITVVEAEFDKKPTKAKSGECEKTCDGKKEKTADCSDKKKAEMKAAKANSGKAGCATPCGSKKASSTKTAEAVKK